MEFITIIVVFFITWIFSAGVFPLMHICFSTMFFDGPCNLKGCKIFNCTEHKANATIAEKIVAMCSGLFCLTCYLSLTHFFIEKAIGKPVWKINPIEVISKMSFFHYLVLIFLLICVAGIVKAMFFTKYKEIQRSPSEGIFSDKNLDRMRKEKNDSKCCCCRCCSSSSSNNFQFGEY